MAGGFDLLSRKKKFKEFFDIIFVSQHGLNEIKKEHFNEICRCGCKIMIESAKYLFPMKNDQQDKLNDQILKIADEMQWASTQNQSDKDVLRDTDILIFEKS